MFEFFKSTHEGLVLKEADRVFNGPENRTCVIVEDVSDYFQCAFYIPRASLQISRPCCKSITEFCTRRTRVNKNDVFAIFPFAKEPIDVAFKGPGVDIGND